MSPLRRALVFHFIVFALCFALGRPASAEPTATPVSNNKVEWKDGQWPRVSPWEGAGTLAVTGLGLLLERKLTGVSGHGLDFAVPVLDPGARFLFRGRSRKVQEVFAGYSDVGWRMMLFFPYVMDVGVVALGVHRNIDVAAQMAMIDLQAFTFSGVTFLIASRLVGRARPYKQDCHPESGGTIAQTCEFPDNGSFYSGHTAAAFTSAGLTCVHHQHLPLYGGGPVESWACVWALGVATATGLFRVVADEHYTSDVIFGAGIGWFYGYVMPKLLHYKSGKLEPAKERKAAGQLQWLPSFNVLDGGGMLTIGTTL